MKWRIIVAIITVVGTMVVVVMDRPTEGVLECIIRLESGTGEEIIEEYEPEGTRFPEVVNGEGMDQADADFIIQDVTCNKAN